ncbi:hypothetical protein [Pseudomonas monteilii]|uniref:hypothetical protein n=1 Tax=Pseudomonas monteilii TaxID=76759 RepID=UPI001E4CA6EF|nr:hypothetical protein [Pseudomonas monteilii]MCE1008784.1 hypothetical protein [Pseudomonas monteilii]MDH0025384.1 hypothetical protein [Pseudomonas monteilii]WJO32429.1 hypothetical protein LU690_25765 [Pseudomonas monteilii]WJR46353.1 hypothetical protein LU654_006995 [Pseudomonas monteilii]
MKKMIYASALIVSTLSSIASAQDCDLEAVKAKWKKMEEENIIYGGGVVRKIPTFSIDERFWSQTSYSDRVNLVMMFDCLLAGPGKALTKARVVNRGGKTLAEWDGVEQSLDIK